MTRATYLFSCPKGVAAGVEGRWAGAACDKPLQELATLLLLLLLLALWVVVLLLVAPAVHTVGNVEVDITHKLRKVLQGLSSAHNTFEALLLSAVPALCAMCGAAQRPGQLYKSRTCHWGTAHPDLLNPGGCPPPVSVLKAGPELSVCDIFVVAFDCLCVFVDQGAVARPTPCCFSNCVGTPRRNKTHFVATALCCDKPAATSLLQQRSNTVSVETYRNI